jgi:cytochrome P450
MEEVAKQFPLGARLRLEELERFDHGALLAQLRETEPVTWFAELGLWLVTPKALVDEVHRSPERFIVDVPNNPQRLVIGDMMLVVDGAAHQHHRGPFAAPFKLGAVRERFTEAIAHNIDRLLSAIEHGRAAELASAFANPFAVTVASDILGLGFERVDEVHDIYTDFADGMVHYEDPAALERARDAAERLQRFLAEGIDRLRDSPDASMLSSVVHAGDDDLGDDELFANLRLILFGAIETVESMILNTTWALLHHPDQVRDLAEDPELWPAAVQEGLRWIPPVGYSDRWAAADSTLAGVPIARGDYVVPVFHAANRDPAAFDDPDCFDIHRPGNRANYSFGKGIHMCLGVNLARLQGQMAMRALFERLPGLRLDPAHPTEPTGFNFRRPEHLHVLWDAARGG